MEDEQSPKRPNDSDEGSSTWGDFSERFEQLLELVSASPLGDRRLQDRYPPEVVQRAKDEIAQCIAKGKRHLTGQRTSDEDASLELILESDRGSVLIAAAWMDELITSVTRKALCSGSDEEKKAGETLFNGFKAPLGDAWAKETILLALGWISPSQAKALAALRQLRNKYAHRSAPVVLTDDDVEGVLKHLDADVGAKIHFAGNQFGAVFEVLSTAEELPFGVKFVPSAAKLRFLLGFTRMRQDIETKTSQRNQIFQDIQSLLREVAEQRAKKAEDQCHASRSES